MPFSSSKKASSSFLGFLDFLSVSVRCETVRLQNGSTEREARTLDARIQIERDDWRDDREGERYGYQWHTKRKEGTHKRCCRCRDERDSLSNSISDLEPLLRLLVLLDFTFAGDYIFLNVLLNLLNQKELVLCMRLNIRNLTAKSSLLSSLNIVLQSSQYLLIFSQFFHASLISSRT